MKRKITFLIAVMILLSLITQSSPASGQDRSYVELFSINSSDIVSSAYSNYSYTDGSSREFLITLGGGNNAVGCNNNSNNWKKCNLSNYSKYAVSPVTTSTSASAFSCETSLTSISKISFKVGGGEYSSTAAVYLIYSSTGTSYSQVTLTSGSQGCTISSTNYIDFEFSPLSGYFALVFTTNNTSGYWRNQNVDVKFYQTKYTVTYNGNGNTSGTAPSATSHVAGTNVTLATQPDGFAKSGYSFDGWYSNATGTGGTAYAAGGTYPSISSDVTLYAKWNENGSPSINASNVNLIQSATSGSIAYTISNPKDGGTLTAEITEGNVGSWLDLGVVNSTNVPLICSANNGAERSATVTLTYTYDNKSTTTKLITVTQAPPQFTVTYKAGTGTGDDYTTDAVNYGSTITVLNYDDTNIDFSAPTGQIFDSWNTESAGTGTSYAPSETFTITADKTLFAQWVDEPTFTLVTDISQIVPGAHCIIANGKGNSTSIYAMGYQKPNNRDAVSVSTTSDGKIKNPGETIYQFVISGYAENWTFHDDNSSSTGFLYAASSGSNYLRTEATLDNNGKWDIVINGTYKYASIVAQGTNTRNVMQFNSNLFACYSDADYDPVYLYIKDNDPDIHPYSSSEYSSGSVTINDAITLSANYNITVGAGATVRFTTAPNCSNASWLVVKEGGQLIIPAAKTGVQATFQREITGFTSEKDGYLLLANPTTDDGGINPTSVTGMLADNYDLYYFDESKNGAEWRNYKQETATFRLVNGTGYLYANSVTKTLNFAGTAPTATSVSDIALSYTAGNKFKGFNLIGNPMAVNITGMKINSTTCSYYKLKSDGTFESATASSTPVIVGQAFVVEASEEGDVLHLNPASKDANEYNDEVIRLEVSNSKYTDVAYVCFGNSLPLTKINHLNDEAPMLYVHSESADRAVAVMNERSEVKSVNVNFEAKTMGTYTISGKAEKGNFSYMHLYDRLTGVDTDLLESDYTFIGSTTDVAGRFILRFEAIDNNSENESFAYQNGSDIIVNGEGELQIFDVMGRMVSTQQINGVERVNVKSQGVYIFRLNEKTQKIVVR